MVVQNSGTWIFRPYLNAWVLKPRCEGVLAWVIRHFLFLVNSNANEMPLMITYDWSRSKQYENVHGTHQTFQALECHKSSPNMVPSYNGLLADFRQRGRKHECTSPLLSIFKHSHVNRFKALGDIWVSRAPTLDYRFWFT